MKTFYLFRHGQTKNKGEKYTKDDIITAQILPDGIPPIKRLAAFLKDKPIDAWYVSEYLRCKQTADIISGTTKKTFIVDRRLDEYDPHLLDETFTHFAERVKSFFDEMLKTEYNNIAICTHGGVIAGLKHLLIDKEFERDDIYEFLETGTITIIKDAGVEVIDFNN